MLIARCVERAAAERVAGREHRCVVEKQQQPRHSVRLMREMIRFAALITSKEKFHKY